MKLEDSYRDIFNIVPRDGSSFLFWMDKWKFAGLSEPLCQRFPRLFSYVLDDKVSAAVVCETQDMASLFHLPLSSQAYDEFCELQRLKDSFPLPGGKDVWNYQWGDSYQIGRAHV